MFGNCFLSEIIEIINQLDYASAATDRTPSAGVDSAGCEGIMFLVKYAAVAGSANKIKGICSDASNLGTPSDLDGSSVSTTNQANGFAWLDVKGPFPKRYIGVVVDKDTINTTAEVAFAFRYGLRKTPVTNVGTAITGERWHAPAAK